MSYWIQYKKDLYNLEGYSRVYVYGSTLRLTLPYCDVEDVLSFENEKELEKFFNMIKYTLMHGSKLEIK